MAFLKNKYVLKDLTLFDFELKNYPSFVRDNCHQLKLYFHSVKLSLVRPYGVMSVVDGVTGLG